jgi:hypothetical protein
MTIAQDAFGLVRELIPNSCAELALRVEPAGSSQLAGNEAAFVQGLPPPSGYAFRDHAGFIASTLPARRAEAGEKRPGRRRGCRRPPRQPGQEQDREEGQATGDVEGSPGCAGPAGCVTHRGFPFP